MSTLRVAIVAVLAGLVLLQFSQTALKAESALPAGRALLGGQAGEDVAEAFSDVLVPFYARGSCLWFFDVRGLLSDEDEEELNLGLVYRHLVPDKNVILGANVFYDQRWTRYDNHFNQAGFGIEVLSQHVDARANYYLPEDDKERIDRVEDVDVDQRSSTRWGDTFTDGNLIRQRGTRKTVTTTTRTVYDVFEQPREGFDAEAGVRVPLPWDQVEAKVFGGYYYFDGDFAGQSDTKGFKARVEVRALPAVYLDAQWYEDKELNGSDWLVGARVAAPFDVAQLARGRNPFAGGMAGFRQGERTIEERMLDMVWRDLAIRTEVSGLTLNEDLSTTETQVTRRRMTRTIKKVVKPNGQENHVDEIAD